MLPISTAAVTEKNKLSSTGAWLVLLEINSPTAPTVRLVLNTEDITWPAAGGDLYKAFSFKIGEIKEDGKGGLSTFTLSVSNLERVLESYVEASDGGKDNTLTLRVVHSDHLDLSEPELEESFENLGCKVTTPWITYNLGAENPMRRRSPKDRYLKDHCRYKEFKGTLCGYVGAATQCDRTLSRCKELDNVSRFGGFPGIGGGVYA